MAKLPKDFLRAAGAEAQLDSPFRRTSPDSVVTPAAAPLPVAPPPPPAAAPETQPAAALTGAGVPVGEAATVQWHRFTVRLPEPLRERLEDEAYRRSRSTKRTIGLADLVREILEERDRGLAVTPPAGGQ